MLTAGITTIIGGAIGWVAKAIIAGIRAKPTMIDAATDGYQELMNANRELMNQLRESVEDRQAWLQERAELKAEVAQLNSTIQNLNNKIAGFEALLLANGGH